jgi:membrane fusion protein (multidrug efflux system)
MLRNSRIFIGLAAATVVAACSESPTLEQSQRVEPAVRVIVEPLQFEPARAEVEAVGTSRALRSVDVYPATSGEVVAVDFEPGQLVSAGDKLVELDRREQELAMELATIQLADAKRLLDRYERSAESGAVVQTVLDEARTAVELARVDLERARIALDDRTVRAAFDGFVGTTEVDRGDRIDTGTMITTLDDRSSLLVSFEVPETLIGELLVGEDVKLETWNSGAPVVKGEIVDIGSRIDPQTRTFIARVQVPNESDKLRPGMSFRVAVDIDGELYPVVAETGVQWGADGAYVWSVNDNTASRVAVQVVQRREGRVLVNGDFDAGDIVVVEGIQRMQEGIRITYESPAVADREDVSVIARPMTITGTADAG